MIAGGDQRSIGALGPAYGSVASSAVIWGSIGLIVRLVHMSAIAITFYRVLIGAVSILFLLFIRGRLGQLRPGSRRNLARLALMSGLYTVNWVLYFYAVWLTTVGNAALAYYTAPAFMALFGALFLNESLDRRTLLYVAAAFAGLYVLLDPSRLGHARIDGILAAAGAGVAYAAAVITAKPLRNTFSPWSVAAYQTRGATLLLAPFFLIVGGSWSPRTVDWAPLLALGLVHTTVAFWLFFRGLKHIPAKRVGFVMYLDPLVAVALSAVLLGEPLTLSTLLGGSLIVGAGLLALKEPTAPTPAPDRNQFR